MLFRSIGYDGNGDRVVELHTGPQETNPNSNAIATAFIGASDRYGQGLSFERKTSSASRFSDHRSFWDYNYPAFLVIENFFTDGIPPDRNPNYHTSNDRLDSVDLDYVVRIGRTALATVAELAGIQEGNVTPTATPTPTQTTTPGTPTATATPTPTGTPIPSGCQNLLQDGGFEDATLVWEFQGAYPGRTVVSPVYAGQHAAQLGVPQAVANRQAYSTAYQNVTIPDWPTEVTLTFWEQPNGVGDGIDVREVRLLRANLTTLASLDRQTSSGDGQWRQRSFDVTQYKGQEVVVYFNVYNNGSGTQLWSYLDEVSLQACGDITATPTSTSTPTPTGTLTTPVTPTPTTSVTPEEQTNYLPYVVKGDAMATPTPTPTDTHTMTPTPTPTSTPTATPTATHTPTDTTAGSPLATPIT